MFYNFGCRLHLFNGNPAVFRILKFKKSSECMRFIFIIYHGSIFLEAFVISSLDCLLQSDDNSRIIEVIFFVIAGS